MTEHTEITEQTELFRRDLVFLSSVPLFPCVPSSLLLPLITAALRFLNPEA